MNFGMIVRHSLNKAELPQDAAFLELAKRDCNLLIQDLWYRVKANFRQSRGTIQSISGSDEYLLNKYFDKFVKNTLQGPSSNSRRYKYLSSEDFFRQINPRVSSSGTSFIYTFGEVVGFDRQLLSASVVRVFSGLANKTVGTVNVVAGSDFIASSTDIFNLNDVGLRFKKDGDYESYKIGKYISPRQLQLTEKYRGTSGTGVAYKIGDVGIHVNIMGFVAGELDSEDLVMDGENVVQSQKTFTTIVSVSKSDTTGGRTIFQNSAADITVGTLAPGDTEIERETVLFWPKPDSADLLQYRFYMHHPYLWLDSDRLLLPRKWHRLVQMKLERKLLDYAGKPVPQELQNDITRIESEYDNEAEEMSLEDTYPDEDGARATDSYFYDHSEVIG